MIAKDVNLGNGVIIFNSELVNLYGCSVGAETKIGAFTEIQKGVVIGTKCKISSHSFICSGVIIEDEVFIGHGVMFTNDLFPKATNLDGTTRQENDWKRQFKTTIVKKGASIGSNSTILAGITIGEGALIGAGSVVTKNVPPNMIVAGNPARILRKVDAERKRRL